MIFKPNAIFSFIAGNAEVYIMLALLIGLVTVIIGCWLSDNCWSPEPEHVVTVAWPTSNPSPAHVIRAVTPLSMLSASSSSSESSPDSDWPLVDVSERDSMNLWQHAPISSDNNNDEDNIFDNVIHVFETKQEGIVTTKICKDLSAVHNGGVVNVPIESEEDDEHVIADNNFVCFGDCDKVLGNSVVLDIGNHLDLL